MPTNDHALLPSDHRILRRCRYLEATIPVPPDEQHGDELHDGSAGARLHDEQTDRLVARLHAEKEAL